MRRRTLTLLVVGGNPHDTSSQVSARFCKHNRTFADLISLRNAQSPGIHSLAMIRTSSQFLTVVVFHYRMLTLGETDDCVTLDGNSARRLTSPPDSSHPELPSSPLPPLAKPVSTTSTPRRVVSIG